MIHLLARSQRTPIRASVARTVSPVMRSSVKPSSKLTWAARSIVHRLVCLPNFLGFWCKSSRKLAQGLDLFGTLEGPVNSMRTFGALLKRLGKSLLVEGMDGIARRLGVATQRAGDLVGVLAPVTGEKYLATTQGEGIR